MNTLKTIRTLFAALLLVFAVSCSSSDSGVTLYKLSGGGSLPGGAILSGANVMLSTMPNAADVVARTVTGADGKYSFMGLAGGTYYLSVKYDPNNTNNLLKSAGAVVLTGNEVIVDLSGDKVVDVEIAGTVSGGTGKVKTVDGWAIDATHSMFEFEFPYDVVNAVFTGHFALAGVDQIDFDEASPSTTKLKGWVDLTSVETGSPTVLCGGNGRDGIKGCIGKTFGVGVSTTDLVQLYCSTTGILTNWPNEAKVADQNLWTDQTPTSYKRQSAVSAKTGVSTFEMKSVEPYGSGYVGKADFMLHGITKEVTIYFNYMNSKANVLTTTTSTSYVSLYGWFKIKALADFVIDSSHVGSNEVTVKVSLQFTKKVNL